MNRCKRQPIIRESFLNETIWTAVKQALQKPDIVVAGIKSVLRYEPMQAQPSVDHDTRALEQIRTEETRILQAYRLGVLTPEQLAAELKALQARTSLISSRKPEQTTKVEAKSIRYSVEHYRQAIPGRLDALDWEQKRKVLQHLVIKITFEGDRVRIVGRVPSPHDNEPSRRSDRSGNDSTHDQPGSTPLAENRDENDIADTTSGSCGRNSPEVMFELVTTVYRDRTAAIVANRANLLKANAARSKGAGAKELT